VSVEQHLVDMHRLESPHEERMRVQFDQVFNGTFNVDRAIYEQWRLHRSFMYELQVGHDKVVISAPAYHANVIG
jgi:hypothetical protein